MSNTYGRTDSRSILSVNLATHEAKLTSLMRDTWGSMYGRRSKAKRIAAGVSGGPGLTMRPISVVTALLPYVETNLDLSELMTLAYVGLQLDMSSIEQLRLPADGTLDSGTYDGVWSIRPNFSENQQILYDFIYGSDE